MLLACASALLAQNPSLAISSSAREQLSLDRGWLFHEGDIPFPVISGHRQSYNNAKAGTSWGAAAPDFDDSSWKQVDLPHDWAVDQPFDQNANISQGYRARGISPGGQRSLFGVSVALSEAEVHWRVFFQSLVQRGLCGGQFIVSDDHPGMAAARKAIFGAVPWQRCQFHLQQNAQAHVPRLEQRKDVARVFPNEASLLRLVSALLAETSDEWELGKIYLNMECQNSPSV